MKTTFLPLFLAVSLTPLAEGATAYWAFQNQPATSGSAYSGTVTSISGFASEPTITKINGGAVSADGGGQASFFDPLNPATEYKGSGGGTGTANSFGWNVDKTDSPTFTGSGFTLKVDMTGLTDLVVAFGLRAAGSSVAGEVPLSFKSIEYSIGSSGTWESAGVSSPTWTVSGAFSNKTVSFAALDGIEGESEVYIRFILADTTAIPTTGTASSIRIDNLVLTAVPEPAVGALLVLPALAFAGRRRR